MCSFNTAINYQRSFNALLLYKNSCIGPQKVIKPGFADAFMGEDDDYDYMKDYNDEEESHNTYNDDGTYNYEDEDDEDDGANGGKSQIDYNKNKFQINKNFIGEKNDEYSLKVDYFSGASKYQVSQLINRKSTFPIN